MFGADRAGNIVFTSNLNIAKEFESVAAIESFISQHPSLQDFINGNSNQD